MDGEITKEDLVFKIKSSYEHLTSFLSELSDNQLTSITDHNGWSIKDFIIHLARWEAGVTNLLRKKDRWIAMNIDEDVWDSSDENRINESIRQKNAYLSPQQAMNLLQEAHQNTLHIIDKLTLEELVLPYNHYDQESDDTRPVLTRVVGNTFGHYEPHLANMKKMVENFDQ